MEMETVCGLCAKELEKEITVGADLYRDLWHGNACLVSKSLCCSQCEKGNRGIL
jgi:hypothetical protein